MHNREEYHQILELWELGYNKRQIAVITRINRTTVRECITRYSTIAGLEERFLERFGLPVNLRILQSQTFDNCPELFRTYALLLGVYLGDGHISKTRNTHKLRIFCDARYLLLIETFITAMQTICPSNRVASLWHHQAACVVLQSYSNSWPLYFPQHGRGRKHSRAIVLEDWQSALVNRFPHEFLKGLLQTDGSRTNNIVNGKNYPRYEFCNHSADIRKLFSDTCDALSIHWKSASMGRVIQIARRSDVEFLDQFIGPKT